MTGKIFGWHRHYSQQMGTWDAGAEEGGRKFRLNEGLGRRVVETTVSRPDFPVSCRDCIVR